MWKRREWKEKQAGREGGSEMERGTQREREREEQMRGHADPDSECEGDKENR